jgi:proteasome lid subunit RPN8/RPN11
MSLELLFSTYAWAKLHTMLHYDGNEIGGFAITHKEHPFFVLDILIPEQKVSIASVDFDDDDRAVCAAKMYKDGLAAEQFDRIWIHTHPGNSPRPSGLDNETFDKVFDRQTHCCMFIIAMDSSCSCKVKVNTDHVSMTDEIPVRVNWEHFQNKEIKEVKFPVAKWRQEIKDKVSIAKPTVVRYTGNHGTKGQFGFQAVKKGAIHIPDGVDHFDTAADHGNWWDIEEFDSDDVISMDMNELVENYNLLTPGLQILAERRMKLLEEGLAAE